MARTRISRREWSRQVERATLHPGDDRVRAAEEVFRGISAPELQIQIAREIVDTRSRELCIAYKNVVMLAVGNKTRRSKDGTAKVVRFPCVVFIVRRKWRKSGRLSDRLQALPKHLLTYATIEGKRILCAVPTDVVSEEGMYEGRPQAPSGLRINALADGSAFCAARLQMGSTRSVVMISCQHVFTPILQVGHPTPVAGGNVALFDAPQANVARTGPNGGQLREDGELSFDVQLADVVEANRALLRRALHGLELSPGHEFVPDRASFDAIAGITQFRIVVSPNITNEHTGARRTSPLHATWFRTWEGLPALKYPMRSSTGKKEVLVYHRELLSFEVLGGRRTIEGDSGSAIVMDAPDGRDTLVGMHIAGGPENGIWWSLAIPAWRLFDPDQYSVLPTGASLAPFNP